MDQLLKVQEQATTQWPAFRAQAQGYAEATYQYYAAADLFTIVRDVTFIFVVFHYLRVFEDALISDGLFGSIGKIWNRGKASAFRALTGLPIIRSVLASKVREAIADIEGQIIEREGMPQNHKVPEQAKSREEIAEIMDKLNTLKRSDWEHGRISGAVYHGGKELLDLQTKFYGEHIVANQLHPDCFPAVRHMEAEIVSMVLDLYNGPPGSCGTSTSGGTESLLLTCLAAREKAREERGILKPEIVAPITIHAGFDKAAHYFGMKLVHAPIDLVTGKVDLKALESRIGPNTVLLAGSAPNFPHGIMDDIEGLNKLALKYRLPLHVDACLGSFVMPFLHEIGVDVPLFDFRLKGVTSISCDTHKYGFAPKGSSIIMYRDAKMRHYQYFVSKDWSGGVYASPTLAGSRPGAIMAGCWATLLYIGKDGYRKSAQSIVEAASKLKAGLRNHPLLKVQLEIVGEPLGSVVSFRARKTSNLNVYDLSDLMSKRGWHLSTLQNPAAIHLAVTRLSLPVVDELIESLVACTDELLAGDTKSARSGTKALYGVASSVPMSGIAREIAEGFIDALYKV